MKKIIYTLAFLSAASAANAQGGFLNKIKNKLTSNAAQNAQQATGANTSTAPDGSAIHYSDPAKFGTLILSYSQAEMNNHPDGYDIWFPEIKVVNNQVVAKVAESNSTMWNYSNGQLQKTGETPPNINRNNLKNGSELDGFSTDFTQTDAANALMKNGRNVTSGVIPGKQEQTYTFNGKVVGSFWIAQIAHNADSSVVAVAGASISGGISYHMNSSAGTKFTFPKAYGALPLISPDGKMMGVITILDKKVYVSNGQNWPFSNLTNNQIWLRNTGNVFNFPDANKLILERNGTLFYKFNNPGDAKLLFLNANETGMAWEGYRGLYFSDGTVFENASSPTKVILDGKEVIVFLDVDLGSGKLYLCRHDL
ncbi:hypothetical protein [Mucilaginibacter flavidus]|uniref:hypothetical protein n=1 Tax=Mucilaginibacter flavidus TaxID=2949309 RepID=UPI0020934963|nr:hypothetical protein [Mucilaginibacter flavidus]MCO5946067.1 hypothetical protein [Mucilaginibacter flavidus]